jgi:hypothetical protein
MPIRRPEPPIPSDSLQAARQHLSDEMLIAALRAFRVCIWSQLPRGINRSLDKGRSLDAIFSSRGYGPSLSVEPAGPDEFVITLSEVVGICVGAGASWLVRFRGNEVESATLNSRWIS